MFLDMLDIDFTNFNEKKVKINFTDIALKQINLIQENDYTLTSKSLRVQISGKECDGFRYEIGFDDKKDQDYEFSAQKLTVYMQPFTAYFCQNITIDYISDGRNDIDGFIVKNHDQDSYQGKFFKDE